MEEAENLITAFVDLPMIVARKVWREKCGGTSDGDWLIADLPNLINRVIKPHISGMNSPAKVKE